MQLATILIRTVLIYFSVLVMMRLMGKREIGKLSTFDLVISIMIAEIAVIVIEDTERPLSAGYLPMLTLVAIQIVTAYLCLKSITIRRWMEGRPSVIIRGGEMNREEMAKQRYTLHDLLLQLRQQNVQNVADVEFALLETTGKLTVVPKQQEEGKESAAPSQTEARQETEEPSNEQDKVRYEGLPLPIVMDGKVQDEHLERIGKTRFWLKNVLQEKGVSDVKDVFLCTIDHRGDIYVHRKDTR